MEFAKIMGEVSEDQMDKVGKTKVLDGMNKNLLFSDVRGDWEYQRWLIDNKT